MRITLDIDVGLRLSEAEFHKVATQAMKSGLDLREFIRRRLVDEPVVAPGTPPDIARGVVLLHQLQEAVNRLERLAPQATAKADEAERQIRMMIRQAEDVVQRIGAAIKDLEHHRSVLADDWHEFWRRRDELRATWAPPPWWRTPEPDLAPVVPPAPEPEAASPPPPPPWDAPRPRPPWEAPVSDVSTVDASPAVHEPGDKTDEPQASGLDWSEVAPAAPPAAEPAAPRRRRQRGQPIIPQSERLPKPEQRKPPQGLDTILALAERMAQLRRAYLASEHGQKLGRGALVASNIWGQWLRRAGLAGYRYDTRTWLSELGEELDTVRAWAAECAVPADIALSHLIQEWHAYIARSRVPVR